MLIVKYFCKNHIIYEELVKEKYLLEKKKKIRFADVQNIYQHRNKCWYDYRPLTKRLA